MNRHLTCIDAIKANVNLVINNSVQVDVLVRSDCLVLWFMAKTRPEFYQVLLAAFGTGCVMTVHKERVHYDCAPKKNRAHYDYVPPIKSLKTHNSEQ